MFVLLRAAAPEVSVLTLCCAACSVVLLGEPGVGKTAIVQGLAQRLSERDVPDTLRESRLIALELGLLIAGEIGLHRLMMRLMGMLQVIVNAASVLCRCTSSENTYS